MDRKIASDDTPVVAFNPKAPVSFSKYLTRSIAQGSGDCDRMDEEREKSAQLIHTSRLHQNVEQQASCNHLPVDSMLVVTPECPNPFLYRFHEKLSLMGAYPVAVN